MDAAKAAPDGMDAATAVVGAMAVMLWNRTSRDPIASRRSPAAPGTTVSPDMCIPLVHADAPAPPRHDGCAGVITVRRRPVGQKSTPDFRGQPPDCG
ncbi:hypothetical protein [Streptomyces viridochromogenes]|uniref:hypothetical protein n=1 Tax=Streptomyces viridochromogenes TaxID=1938 RepID=UPI00190FB2A2|nr:hypothetical protein [Streptomyces viridochromogenes]